MYGINSLWISLRFVISNQKDLFFYFRNNNLTYITLKIKSELLNGKFFDMKILKQLILRKYEVI